MTACRLCEQPFASAHGNQKYCSARCRQLGGRVWTYGNITLEHARERVRVLVCVVCGNKITSPFKWRYCSDRCGYNYKISQAYTRQYRYGLSPQGYQELLTKQDGRCAVCGREPDVNTPLVVDHDHTTNVVRGLLCGPCNISLGHYERLKKEIDEYLNR